MGRGNNNTGIGMNLFRQVGNGRGADDAQHVGVAAGAADTGRQGAGQHVARQPRILPDNDFRPGHFAAKILRRRAP